MLSTLKSLSLLALLTSSVFAITNNEMVKFVKDKLSHNKDLTLKGVSVRDSFALDGSPGWKVFIVDIKGSMMQQGGVRDVSGQDVLFANGKLIAPELINIKTGKSIKSTISPTFKNSYYTEHNRVMGNKNAKYKIALFSDPLCPYCIKTVKKMLPYIKKHPKTFALYYYHFPLLSLHPASKTIVKAMDAAIKKGKKNVLELVYNAKFNAMETNELKILKTFNKALRMNLTMKDLNHATIAKYLTSDKRIAAEMLVNSTPTVFFNGKKDADRDQYKKVKKID